MPRLFTALSLPEPVRMHLSLLGGGIPGARWESIDKMHLTLRFIGEVDGGEARDIRRALESVQHDPFQMVLQGTGHFPPRGQPRSIWVGVRDPEPLVQLHEKIDCALSRVGVDPDTRKFAPHVTLARLKSAPISKVAAFEAHHNLFCSEPIDVTHFALLSSVLGPGGSKYRTEQVFPF